MASKSSNILDYFEKLNDDYHGAVGKCNTCKGILKTPGGTTSALRKHLKTHPKQAQLLEEADKQQKKEHAEKRKVPSECTISVEQPPKKKQMTLSSFLDSRTKYDIHSDAQKSFDDKVVKYIIKDLPTLNSINCEGFKELLEFAAPRYTIKDRTTYARKIEGKYENILQEVKDIVSKCKPEMESIACTTDMWTS